MPKISIREIDNTGSETLEYLDYTVLVPGIKLQYDDGEGTILTMDGLYETFSQFETSLKALVSKLFESESGTGLPDNFYDDIGFITACECLRKGLSVQYVGAYEYDDDGVIQVDEDFKFSTYEDKGKYDLRFITVGAMNSSDYMKQALNAAANRGDAVALLDVPEGELTDGTPSTLHIIEWLGSSGIQDECAATITRYGTSGTAWTITETKGRYGYLFTPQFITKIYKIPNLTTGIDCNNTGITFKWKLTQVSLPASLDYLGCFGKHFITGTSKYNPWYALAGSKRGVSPYTINYPDYEYGDADIKKLEVRDQIDIDDGSDYAGRVSLNPICQIKPYGYILWGNRTMQPLSKPEVEGADELAYQLTAASFANIRQLCCTIKKTLYRASRRFTFEPNSDVLWLNFKAAITPTLEKMKADNGIRGYMITKESTSKKALLVARVTIVPIEPVEDFDLTVEMSDSVAVTE